MTAPRFLSRLSAVAALTLAAGLAAPAAAHTPLAACYDMGDGTILCEGGFSDGSSAAGVPVRVTDGGGAVLIEGKMNDNSEFEFDKPAGAYSVNFDAGEGHQIEIPGRDIVQ